MTWTRKQLEAEWIGGPLETLRDRAPVALTAFETVERHFGVDWLSAQRKGQVGPLPTLSIIHLGECLSSVEHAIAQALADSDRFETVDVPGLALVIKEPFTGPVITPPIILEKRTQPQDLARRLAFWGETVLNLSG